MNCEHFAKILYGATDWWFFFLLAATPIVRGHSTGRSPKPLHLYRVPTRSKLSKMKTERADFLRRTHSAATVPAANDTAVSRTAPSRPSSAGHAWFSLSPKQVALFTHCQTTSARLPQKRARFSQRRSLDGAINHWQAKMKTWCRLSATFLGGEVASCYRKDKYNSARMENEGKANA